MMTNQRIKYQNLKKYHGGIIWVKKYSKRIEVAIKILKHLRNEWSKVVWIANAGYVDNSEYKDKIKEKLGKLYNNVYFFHMKIFH